MNTIGWAIKEMQDGRKVRRSSWNGKGMHLYYVPEKAVSVNTDRLPYIEMFTATRDLVPWLCSQTDLLATDWELAE